MQTATRTPEKRSLKRTVVSLALVLLLCLCAIQFGRAEHRESAAQPGSTSANAASQPPQSEVIDGAANPANIPDHVAYGLVFRLIAGRQTDAEKRSIRAYINQLGLGDRKCLTVSKGKERPESEAEINAMVAAAEEYGQKVSVLDQQARAIHESSQGELTADKLSALANLQRQKEALVMTTVAALEQKLGPDAAARLRQSIMQRVKRQVKIRHRPNDAGQQS